LQHAEQGDGGEEIFTVVLEGSELPDPEGLCLLGDGFEVRWWQEQVEAANARVAALEHDRAYAIERERAEHAETAERLKVASRRLLATEQELASVPTLAARVEELEDQVEELRRRESGHATTLDAAKAEYETSLSWRVTAPLRLAKRRFRG
jgi:outer membrane murein-binding lipoprotein Lpp